MDYEFEEPGEAGLVAQCARLRRAQPAWADGGLDRRVAALRAFGRALRAHERDILQQLQEDTGRVAIARVELEFTLAAIERACADAPAVLNETAARATGHDAIAARQQKVPYGLVLNIAPWNFPLLLSLFDVFPALVAGNAAIVKPSEVTPRWVAPVQAALAGVPELAAVLGFAVGTGRTGARLIGEADCVSFTGSVATGRKVAEAAAARFIPAYLELGGKDPAIVLRSADIDAAAAKILASGVGASGQACQSLERVYVDQAIAAPFIDKLVALARATTINYPDKAAGTIGPFIFGEQAGIVAAHLRDALDRGATVRAGGHFIEQGGCWLEATILTGVTHDMRVMTEETFGPVLPVMTFTDEEQAVQLANDSRYGLSASVFTGSLEEGRRIARRLNAGAVAINDASVTARIHEVGHESFRFSGLGRSRFGHEAIARYTRTKAIFENPPAVPA